MKDLCLYFEIDEVAGFKMKLGSLPDDKYDEAVEMLRETKPDVKELLAMIGLEEYADDCRIITEEEYNENYGEE